MFYFAVTIISLCAGFFSGLLGIGGGIIIFPAFLYIMPVLGFEPLSINQITGLATIQILAGSIFAFYSHKDNSHLANKSLVYIGISAALGAFIGAVISAFLYQKVLLVIYLFILIIAFVSMTFFKPNAESDKNEPKKNLVKVLCFFSGTLGGALGLGGGILYIPILRHFYKISTKMTIGNVNFIVFCGAVLTFIGKALTGQIPYYLMFFTLIGSFIGAKAGAFVSKKLPSSVLKNILLIIITLTAIRVFISIIIS